MRFTVSEAAAGARYQWPAIFERLGIAIPPGHRHGPCPFCGGKDRFRMDDLDGRGTWFCNNCGAGDGLDLVVKMTGYTLIRAANVVMALELQPLTPPAREKWQAGNMDARVRALLRHCQPGDAPYLTARGWERRQWLLTERSSRTIAGLYFGTGTLVLPVRTTGMRLTGAQFISPNGRKYMLPGSHLKGGFCPVHQATDNGIPAPWG